MENKQVVEGWWKNKGVGRNKGYQWLAKQMGLPERLAHIGGFEMDQCQKVIDLCRKEEEDAA